MRCFIAIDLPQDTRQKMHTHIQTVTASFDSVKIVSVNNIHLTLKFLGEITTEVLEAVSLQLDKVCVNHNPFTLCTTSAGVFANINKPNVFWIGIEESKHLQHLYQDIQSALLSLNLAIDNKPFKPHITLARLKNPKNAQQIAKAWLEKTANIHWGCFDVSSVQLYQSTLTTSGAIYKSLKTFCMGKK